MTSTSLVRSRSPRYSRYYDYSGDWLDEPPRRWGSFFRFILAVTIGVGSTLAWQYHDQVREKLAGIFPQLGRPAATGTAARAPTGSADHQQLVELTAGLDALRQRVDQLSQQLAALAALPPPQGGTTEPRQRIETPVEQTGNPPAAVSLPRHLVAASSPEAVSEQPPSGGAAELQHSPDLELKPPQLAEQAPSASPVALQEICKHDAARLARLRMTQERDEVTVFERDLGCEELRPQVLRLRESLDPR